MGMPARVVVLGVILAVGLAAATCEGLSSLTIPNTKVVASSSAGSCRVIAVFDPPPDSEITIAIWLPAPTAWNGKLLGTGNGGYSSAFSTREMEAALRQGYAVTGSDTGHQGGDLKFGIGHPEKIRDWGYRAIHVMTETAKLIVRAYYGRFPATSYFSGCSTGGHQALTEAQRYPDDYDGILAGAPGNNRVHLNAAFLWNWNAVHNAGAEFPASKLPLLNSAAIAACDALDGLKDGLIADPRACQFDPALLLCKNGDAPDCLTRPEIDAAKSVYRGTQNPRTGELVYPGWLPGSEAGWNGYFVGQREPARLDFWRVWVFHDPSWDFHTFDFDRDLAYADKQMSFLVANETNLTPFTSHNGKLLLYQGWADPVVSPVDTIRYFESVQRALGGADHTTASVRLFLAPGMGHCAAGTGPSPTASHLLDALDRWVTQNAPPAAIIASHSQNGSLDRTRPLCPYPLVARWNGSGSINDAASFTCAPR